MNPEFQRNLWLELPPHRLVAMPAVLVLVFFAAWLAGGSLSFSGSAQGLIALLLIVWGSRLTSESILSELIGRTWDSQRMSAITPWEMTWGKLLGSTAFMWYGSAWCVAAFIFSPHGNVGMLVRLLLAGIQAQALAMLLSMILIRGEPTSLRFQVTVAQTLTILVMAPFLFFTMVNRPEAVLWYGSTILFDTFITLSQVAFIGWTVWSVYQQMRAELQYQTGPLTWLFFGVFMVTFVAGFDRLLELVNRTGMPTPAVTRLFVAFCAAIAVTYVCALIEPKSIARLRRWLTLLRAGRFNHAIHLSPTWLGGLLIAVVIGLLTVVNITALNGAGSALPVKPIGLVVAILLFAIRDLAMFYYFVLYAGPGRSTLGIILYLITGYFLVPVVLSSARLDLLVPALVPTPNASPEMAVLPVLIEAVVALVLVIQRWHTIRLETLEPATVGGHHGAGHHHHSGH